VIRSVGVNHHTTAARPHKHHLAETERPARRRESSFGIENHLIARFAPDARVIIQEKIDVNASARQRDNGRRKRKKIQFV